MIKEMMERISTYTLTDLSWIEVRHGWEVSLATVLTVVILNTGAKILVEALSFCALIRRVHVFEMWMLV